MEDKDVMVKVEHVSKKFCKRLKRSLVYGMQDIIRELMGLPKTNNLRKQEFWAVDDVSFKVKKGEAVGLIGPNGAGKSSLLKVLNGLIKPDIGRVEMKGRVCALIELGTGFNPILTGRENVYINGSVLGLTRKEIDAKFNDIVAFSEIEEFIDAPVQSYSSGMRVRLGFAVAAHMEPDVLLIDEVLAVGDARFKLKCFDHLEKLKASGTAIIIVSHAMVQLNRICNRIIVFNKGQKIFDGDIQKGILQYDKLMLDVRAERHLAIFPYNGQISINPTIKNGDGELTNNFRTNDDIIIELLISSEVHLENLRMSFCIDSSSKGIVGVYWTPFTDFEFDIIKGESSIQLSLPKIALLTGAYSIDFALNGPEKEDVLWYKRNLITLEVYGPNDKIGYGARGMVLLDHEWKKN